jgi:hypothetical protein
MGTAALPRYHSMFCGWKESNLLYVCFLADANYRHAHFRCACGQASVSNYSTPALVYGHHPKVPGLAAAKTAAAAAPPVHHLTALLVASFCISMQAEQPAV